MNISKLEPNDTTKVAMLELEVERLIADVESRGKSIMMLENENERLRAGLRAAGINLITASNTIERLGDLQDAEATRRMAKQILPLVNEQRTVKESPQGDGE